MNAERDGSETEAGPGGPDQRAAPGPRIWIVNADHWPRAYLRAELIERGYHATGFETLRQAAVRLTSPGSARPALLVLDLHEQGSDEAGRALFVRHGVPLLIVAPARYQDDEDSAPLVEILRRPVAIGDIADAVDRRGLPRAAQLR